MVGEAHYGLGYVGCPLLVSLWLHKHVIKIGVSSYPLEAKVGHQGPSTILKMPVLIAKPQESAMRSSDGQVEVCLMEVQ